MEKLYQSGWNNVYKSYVFALFITVVSLRQLERQHGREKERSGEVIALQEEQSRLEVGRLTRQLKDSERDRNLLMVCII